MSEPSEPGTRVEYAVRYDAPSQFAGVVTNICKVRSFAEGNARALASDPRGPYRCTVVQREVTYGEWTETP